MFSSLVLNSYENFIKNTIGSLFKYFGRWGYMYKLLLVADEMPEKTVLYEILQMHAGNLCEIYEAKNETEAMDLLSNNWGITKELKIETDLKTKTEDERFSKIKKQIEGYVRKHYMEEISAYDAAEQMNYSEAYFCKLFKQCFGINFTSYLAKYRVKEAKKLLEISNKSAKEIGKACGYVDPCYFTRVFKREVGCTPSEYRNRYLKDAEI